MKLILSQAEKREFLLSILANGGLAELSAGGSEFFYDDKDYRARRKHGDTYEEVLVRMIMAGDEVRIDDKKIDIANLKLVPNDLIMKVINEEDDAWTGYDALQYLAFGELLYG